LAILNIALTKFCGTMNNLIYTSDDSEIVIQDFADFKLLKIREDTSKGVDQWMTDIIQKDLQESIYVNIYIPICFGRVLSDFLGLRLSLHIRTTISKNTLVNIFLYGTEDVSTLYKTDFFEILKTRGFFLVDYNINSIKNSVLSNRILSTRQEVISEMNKLSLRMPGNLYDNHSVGNIWGMYRLLELSNIDYRSVKSLLNSRNDLNNIYFKWLITKNEAQVLVTNDVVEKRTQYLTYLTGPKVIGKIDLPSEKRKKK